MGPLKELTANFQDLGDAPQSFKITRRMVRGWTDLRAKWFKHSNVSGDELAADSIAIGLTSIPVILVGLSTFAILSARKPIPQPTLSKVSFLGSSSSSKINLSLEAL